MLARLRLPFRATAPNIDEQRGLGETPRAMARRLALEKARAVALEHDRAIVIGADQVVSLNGLALGKPGSLPLAIEQLQALSGQRVVFHSAVAVISPFGSQLSVSDSIAKFRKLSSSQITYYVQADQPTDTAGSAKAEQLGIALLEELSSDDPTAIIGLPLIELTRMLGRTGLDPLSRDT